MNGEDKTYLGWVQKEIHRARRYDLALSFAVFAPVDHKEMAAKGISAVERLGAGIAAQARRADVVHTLSDEEVAVLLPHTGLDGALAFARRVISQLRLSGLSVCAGVTGLGEHIETSAQLLSEARTALQKARELGADAVRYSGEGLVEKLFE